MTLRPLFPVTQQFQNKNGSILVSGKIYIYYQGRTALATTYHDEDGKVVNSNPVLLDNNGRATVFADTAYSYTIVVCDYYGKELFSQDITLHDVTETADEITLIGSDGSIHIDTSSYHGIKTFDMSANTDILATKKSVDDLGVRVKKNEDDINVINGQVESISTEMSGKKDKQSELNFNGSATKTVKSITQNANGELNVEFADIDLPQEVPNVEITSEDSSVNITSSVDAGTNTKTFDLSVNVDDKIPDPATSNPLMDGTASVGSSSKYAREDHVHPSDTSKESVSNKTSVVLGTSNSKYPTDKAVAEFVNSSIATNTANYISNNGEPFTSVEELEAYTGTVTDNDYAFVTGTDSEGNTYYDRYKATVSGSTVTWALEYRLNNSSFTAAQWSAINSGITAALVAKIHDHSNKDVLDDITSSDIANWNSKQNSLTFDSAPTDGSNNPVTSKGIYKSMYILSKPVTPSSFTKDGVSYSFVCRTNVNVWTRAAFEGYAFPVDWTTFDVIRIRTIVYSGPPKDKAILSITCGKQIYEKFNFVQAVYNGYCYIFANNPYRPLYINPNKYINSDMNSSSMTQDIFQTLTLTKITPSIDDVILEDTPKDNSTNPITSGGVKTAIDKLQSKLTFDTTPTAGSNNPVTSDGINSRIPAPTSTTGTQVLKCINGVIQWINE